MNQERQGFHISHVYSLRQDLSHHTIIFELVTLTLKFDLLFKNLTLVINLWTMRNRGFCVTCEALCLASVRPSVYRSICLSGSHTFLVVRHSYVSQATNAFLGMLPLCSYFTCALLLTRPFTSYHNFYAPKSIDICLVYLSVVNFNLRYNFWKVRDRVFIFGLHTPLMMPFQMTPRSMNLLPWIWPLW